MNPYLRHLPLVLAILLPHLLWAGRSAEYWLYRLTPLAVRNAGASLQISEVAFYLDGVDILRKRRETQTNLPDVFGSSVNGNEGPRNLIDGSLGTKWLALHDGFVVFEMKVPTRIDGYMIWTANDFNRRDPLGWRLEGSDNGLVWTVLDTVWNFPTPTARHAPFLESGIFELPAGAMIDFFSVGDASRETPISPFFVVEEGKPITLTWSTRSAESVRISPDVGFVEEEGTVTITPPRDADTIYTLTAVGSDGLARTAAVRVESRRKSPHAYRYIRFDVVAEAAVRDSFDALQLSRFLFFRHDLPVYPVNITNVFGSNPSGEHANNLRGSTNAKWLDYNLAHRNDSHLVFDFGETVEIDAYQLGTANDFPGRDPLRWRLYGRNSGLEEWVRIENMDRNFPVPTERYALTSVIPLEALPGTAIRSFEAWRNARFAGADRTEPAVSGPWATPASDGVPNLLKYAFGLAPETSVPGVALPQAEMTDEGLRLTYPERVAADDIEYLPEKSFDLLSWEAVGIVESAREPMGDGTFERVTVTLDPEDRSRAFLRIRVRFR